MRQVLEKARSLIAARYQNVRDPDHVAKVTPESLLSYYGNVYSQVGQDGILAEIFRRIGIHRAVYVEVGAWDGVYLSNCRHLYDQGWKGILIEAKPRRLSAMRARFANATFINAVVGAPGTGVPGKGLDDLLNGQDLSQVALVSIDVDGPDLEIFRDMGFSPAVVVVEGGTDIAPNYANWLPAEVAWQNIHQPLAIVFDVARERGYVPVCQFQDTFLVREDLSAPFKKYDPVTLYADFFHFMTTFDRDALVRRRASTRAIVRAETQYFSRFSDNPLGYL